MASKSKKNWWTKYQYTPAEFIIRIILFGVIVFLFLNYRGIVISASVNGEAISRFDVIRELEKQNGQQTLEGLINQLLVEQKAREALVQVSEEEIQAEFTELENSLTTQGESLDDILAIQGMTREQLREQITTQLQIEKLLEGDITVSDEEIDQYLEQNADFLPQDMTEEEKRQNARDQLKQQKLSQRFSQWISELRQEADITYYTEY